MVAWSRSAMARSASGISAILASTSCSPSALAAPRPRRPFAFSSRARSFIAPRSSSVNPSNVLPVAVLPLADFCVSVTAGSSPAGRDGDDLMLESRHGGRFSKPDRSVPGYDQRRDGAGAVGGVEGGHVADVLQGGGLAEHGVPPDRSV